LNGICEKLTETCGYATGKQKAKKREPFPENLRVDRVKTLEKCGNSGERGAPNNRREGKKRGGGAGAGKKIGLTGREGGWYHMHRKPTGKTDEYRRFIHDEGFPGCSRLRAGPSDNYIILFWR